MELWVSIMVDKSPKSGCGTPSKWSFVLAEKHGGDPNYQHPHEH